MNRHAVRACGLSVAMVAMAGWAQAANTDLGSVVAPGASFLAAPALPAVTSDNYHLRSVAIDDTYSFTVTTQSNLSATLISTALAGMGGTVDWSLNYSLLDAQSNVLAIGVLNPTPSIRMSGQCQTVQGHQVNCSDTNSTYTTNLTANDLQAGLYKLRITGTETTQIYAGEGFGYGGTVTTTAVPEPGTAATLALGLLGLGCVTRRKVAKAA